VQRCYCRAAGWFQYIEAKSATILPDETNLIMRELYMNSRERTYVSPSNGINKRKWTALVSGAAVALYGVSRKSWTGAALAGAGGYLIYAGVRTGRAPKQFEVKRSITINKPAEELYQFWRNVENLPSFMEHLESVTQRDGVSHWVVQGPLHRKIEWDARISQEHPNALIRWHSLPGSPVDHRGSVHFARASGDRGTVVTVTLEYGTPAGKAGNIISSLFGKNPEQIIREELRHFKQLMEAGEIATTLGQPAGQRGIKGSAMEKMLGERTSQSQADNAENYRRHDGGRPVAGRDMVGDENDASEKRDPAILRRIRA
jgi:uncharacterized membrane protein